MTKQFPTPCAGPRCPALCFTRFCEKCQKRHDKLRERARPKTQRQANSKKYGRRQARWRKLVLARHPICCGYPESYDCNEPSTVADHKDPLPPLGTGDWSLDNGQGLCIHCHGRKTAHEVGLGGNHSN